MQARGDGVLAIWNDCREGAEAAYEAWYMGEHLAERVGTPGFIRGRRYAHLRGAPRYFTCYDTASPDVLFSRAYLERIDNPTPLTTAIMSGPFHNLNRTVCRRVRARGAIEGAFAVTVRVDADSALALLHEAYAGVAPGRAPLRAELWAAVADEREALSAEEKLRGGDSSIRGGLLVTAVTEAEALAVADDLEARLAGAGAHAAVGVYRLMCTLAQADMAV